MMIGVEHIRPDGSPIELSSRASTTTYRPETR